MSTNTVTLTLKGTSNMQDITASLRSIGTEAKNAGAPLNQLTKSMDQTSKSSQTFGQRLKSFGSNFGQLTASVGSLGGSLVGLTRQYQDLGDSQIRVDRVTLKLSKSQEAARAAHAKLNALQAKGIKSGTEYEQALLDVQQAEEQVKIQTQLLTEAQEDHQRAQEDFWIGLVPTITSAAGTIMGVLQNLIGKKGFGGITEAVATAGTAIGTGGGKAGGGGSGFLGKLSGVIPVLGGITAGAGAGVLLTSVVAEAQKGLDVKTGITDRTPPLMIPFIGDEKSRKVAIDKYESDIKLAQAIAKKTGKSPSLFDFLLEGLGLGHKVSDMAKEAGISIEQLSGDIQAGVAPATEWVMHLEEIAVTSADVGAKGYVAAEGIKSVGDAAVTGNAPVIGLVNNLKYFATLTDEVGREAQFLDASLQPLGAGAEDLASNLALATANLAASGSGVNILTAAFESGKTKVDAFVKSTEKATVADQGYAKALYEKASAMGVSGIAEDTDTRILELLIEAQIAASHGADDLAAAKRKEAQALGTAANAASRNASALAKMNGALGNIPKGANVKYFAGGKQVTGPEQVRGVLGAGFSVNTTPSNYFANLRKKNPSGQTPAYRAAHHQHGFTGMITTPTWMLTGEAGPEHVDVAPLRGGRRRGPSGGWGGGGGAGGGSGHCFNIYIGGKRIMEDIRYSINDNAGVMK